MPSYCAFLGHQPHISLAELIAVVPGFRVLNQPQPHLALFESSEPLHQGTLSRLGGTFALAERVGNEETTLSDGPQIVLKLASGIRGKVTFGLRTAGLPPTTVKENYRRYKETLRRAGRPCRYVGNARQPAAAALLHDAGMLSGKHGLELTIIALPGEAYWIGRTVAAQDVDAYTLRDMGKPVRDTTTGLLPPKLAQVMLNLGLWLLKTSNAQPATSNSRVQHKRQTANTQRPIITVLDPFCGTGVIPLEALTRGWNVLASDVSLKAVNGCRKNIEWLRKEMKILKKDVASEVWKQDAVKPFSLKQLPDLIVTETTLGPGLTRPPSAAAAEKLRKQIAKVQEGFLENAAHSLPGVPIVCTWPFWRLHGGTLVRLTRLWEKIAPLGYRAVLPVLPRSRDVTDLSLLYRRPDQIVGREIVLLTPLRPGRF
jgi:tRNA G10  N-methylase Trm11